MNAWNGGGYNPYAMGGVGYMTGYGYATPDPYREQYAQETGKATLNPQAPWTLPVQMGVEKYALEQAAAKGPIIATTGALTGAVLTTGALALASLPITWPVVLAGAAIASLGSSMVGDNVVKYMAKADITREDISDNGVFDGSALVTRSNRDHQSYWSQKQQEAAKAQTAAQHQAPGSTLETQKA
jgi:hypothetical protein